MPDEFIYVVHPTRLGMLTEGPTAEESAAVAAHFDYLKRLTAEGTMVLVGRTQTNDETTFGIAVFRAGSDEEARAIMAADPAVACGVMRAELYPFHIALAARELSGKG